MFQPRHPCREITALRIVLMFLLAVATVTSASHTHASQRAAPALDGHAAK